MRWRTHSTASSKKRHTHSTAGGALSRGDYPSTAGGALFKPNIWNAAWLQLSQILGTFNIYVLKSGILMDLQMEPEERDSLPSINLRDSSMEMGDNSRGIEVGSEIVSGKRKLTSDVWAHFNRIKVDGCQYGECKHCGLKLKAPSKNGTSSLGKHYNLSCKKKPGSSGVRQSPSMANKKVVGSQEHKTFNEEETRRELAMMVVLHDYLLSIVDHVGFRRFVASFKSSFEVMSGNTLKNDIMKIYSDERVKCHYLLEKLKCRIAITTDMWTSRNNKKGFMAITGHYIDESWVLQSCILRFIYVPAPHTAKALSGQFNRALIDWKIDRKLSKITVDNCSKNDVMLARLVEKLPRRDMLLNGNSFDVLSWWKVNGLKYPTLQAMERDILAIPISTVASESAFSTSGRLISPHRNRLHPSTVEALMCSRSWLWKEANGTCPTFGDLSTCPTILDEKEEDTVEEEEEGCGVERLS
ncbi:hypothetical protein BUALT_Bualt17G0082100 [Buddleja alternifolia]|uniref:BED-type domain-containing protein n=1 Tax=Buddleja alternifolia TaxID=168488 RepID=A0AAV6WHR2_9LAMI|nr:hypothetical protein BUALT_Bualt17G0082100 [Buddleja alternifolia]